MVETKLIETPVHGRYLFRAGDRDLLIAGFHGYGENAEAMLRNLETIPAIAGWSIASIQALHPFYTRSQDEVVASWMTRLDRDHAIGDNIEYVRRVITALGSPRITILCGFSQGVAMAFRAATAVRAAGIIALGGDVPPDVRGARMPPVLIGRGRRDDWYTREKLDADLEALRQSGTDVEVCEFHGGHEWSDEFRLVASRFLARLTSE